MGKFIDLTGQVFCKWTVVGRAPDDYVTPDNRKYPLWRCRCECGTEANVLGSHLRSRNSGRCRRCKYEQLKLMGRMPAHMYHRVCYNAKSRGIPVSPALTRQFMHELFVAQGARCAITGIAIEFPGDSQSKRRTDVSASLDRIDSTRPYEPGNVQWVHKDINKMKLDFPMARFVELCELVVAAQRDGICRVGEFWRASA